MFTLHEITKIVCGGCDIADSSKILSGVSTDSRTIKEGELFIALKGDSFDGSKFVMEAHNKGAIAAIVEGDDSFDSNLPILRVEDSRRALGSIAKAHREKFDIPIIAITGSNGKTTVKDLIAHILSIKFNVLKTANNENNQIGVPRTLLMLNKDHDVAVIEIGASEPGEVRYNADIAKPDIALITNVGPSHLDGLKDIRGVLEEKISLVESIDRDCAWIKNYDDELLSEKNYDSLRVIRYGIANNDVDLKASDIRYDNGGTEFKLRVTKKTEERSQIYETYNIQTSLLGIGNVYNLLSAIAASSLFMDVGDIVETIRNFKPPKMRMEVMDVDGFMIINDAYNSNPLSLRYALDFFRDLSCRGNKIFVCGDMLELGQGSESLHYDLGKMVSECGIDYLITHGERSLIFGRGALDAGMREDRVKSFMHKNKLKTFLSSIAKREDAILIKGSRSMKMEEVIDCFITYSTP
ncbi:UDP-N-acetylmuramoyl-tripeptide--D-alanyl-D-alanine ligase [Candidatus Omnitrophota bacterium]